MGYRDDRDAAYERAEALAADVARSNAEVSEKDRQIQLLHQELAAARTRPPTAEELEDRQEARRQGRRQTVRVITLIVGMLSLVVSTLTTIVLGVLLYTAPVQRAGYAAYVEEYGGSDPDRLPLAHRADEATVVGHSVLSVALLIISVGMVGRTRWSAWLGAAWSVAAVSGALASGVIGHMLVGLMSWGGALFWALPALFFGLYALIRIRYELR